VKNGSISRWLLRLNDPKPSCARPPVLEQQNPVPLGLMSVMARSTRRGSLDQQPDIQRRNDLMDIIGQINIGNGVVGISTARSCCGQQRDHGPYQRLFHASLGPLISLLTTNTTAPVLIPDDAGYQYLSDQ